MTMRNLKRTLKAARRQMRMVPSWSKAHHDALATLRAVRCDLYVLEKNEYRSR